MRITGVALILFLLLQNYTAAQHNPGARQISLSHSDVALSNDVFALFNNPAGLAQITWREAGIYHSPSPFGLTELSNSFAAYTEPFSFGSAALGAMTYGYELYRETKIVLGLAYKYADILSAGISFSYNSVSIKKYGSDNALCIAVGNIIHINEYLSVGFSLHNVSRSTFGKSEGQIPTIINTGISFKPLKELSVNAAIEKDLIFAPTVMAGIEYQIIKYIYLRTGFSAVPENHTAGLGIEYSIFRIDYALFTHSDLGITHQAGLIISFGKEDDP